MRSRGAFAAIATSVWLALALSALFVAFVSWHGDGAIRRLEGASVLFVVLATLAVAVSVLVVVVGVRTRRVARMRRATGRASIVATTAGSDRRRTDDVAGRPASTVPTRPMPLMSDPMPLASIEELADRRVGMLGRPADGDVRVRAAAGIVYLPMRSPEHVFGRPTPRHEATRAARPLRPDADVDDATAPRRD